MSAAIRLDDRTGTREVAEFFGSSPLRLFGCAYLPAENVGGVVVCPSVHAEFHRNYHREVELGRHMVAEGFAVQRFHYRGAGHSDGDRSTITLDTMIEDALSAAEHLSGRDSIDRLGFVGTRLGAVVAAAAASRFDGSPVALWEPVIEPDRYVREILRAGRIHELRKEANDPRSQKEQVAELRSTGTLDALGYTITRPLYESLAGRTLERELGSPPRALLLVEIGRGSKLRREYSAAAERWAGQGFDVATHVVDAMTEPWWFVRGRSISEEESLTEDLVQATARWLGERFAAAGESP